MLRGLASGRSAMLRGLASGRSAMLARGSFMWISNAKGACFLSETANYP